MHDRSDRRILGAFRMVSATTGTAVDTRLSLDTGQLEVIRNRSGVYVVRNAPGMSDFTTKFDLQGVTVPPQQSFELTVRDKDFVYLPRRFQLTIPRKIAAASDPDSVRNAVQVQMYPSAAAPAGPSWALLRVSVVKAGAAVRTPLPWTLLQVKQKSDGTLLKSGLADQRGEALIAVVGLAMRAPSNGGGGLLSSDVDVEVTAIFDPANSDKPKDYVPDPDDLLARMGSDAMKRGTQQVTITSGKSKTVTMEVAV